jgi:hypothetical protein
MRLFPRQHRGQLQVGATVIGLVTACLAGLTLAGSPALASISYQCKNVLARGYYTIVCGVSKLYAEHFCARQAVGYAGILPYSFKSGYASGSSRLYDFSFGTGDIHGCDPVGIRRTAVFQQLRDGATGSFVDNSNVFSTTSNEPRTYKGSLIAPYSCTTDMPESAVRSAVTVTWIPRKQFLKSAKPTTVTTDAPPQPICPQPLLPHG